MSSQTVLEELAAEYPQLYLDPDRETRETYRQVVLCGEEPVQKSLAHYSRDTFDKMDIADTPAGKVRVVSLGNRRDFELVMRGLMAAKNGPQAVIPESTGASMLTVFNWPRIRRHLAAFPKEQQDEEFRKFTSVKENYLDMLVLLSRGPYSHVDAEAAGHTQEEWLEISDTIRRFHELTHVICRRLYPDRIHAVWDELVADAVGLYAAYGCFDLEKEKLFLGIRDGHYVGGRLENYTDRPEQYAATVSAVLDCMKALIEEKTTGTGAEHFDLILILMDSDLYLQL